MRPVNVRRMRRHLTSAPLGPEWIDLGYITEEQWGDIPPYLRDIPVVPTDPMPPAGGVAVDWPAILDHIFPLPTR